MSLGRLSQAIDFSDIGSKTYGNPPIALQATATSGLYVGFRSDNENVLKIEGNAANIVGTGTVTITAYQGGNDEYFPAAPVKRVVKVSKANQKILFDAIPELFVNDPPFEVTASATSALSVYYRSSDSAVAIMEENKVLIKGEGETTITAYQDGNENFNAAFPVSKILRVKLVTGTETVSSGQFEVYPNPVTSQLFIERESLPSGNLFYSIYNTASLMVASGEILLDREEKGSIDMTRFPKGIYILRVVMGGKYFFQKIIKT